jgi:signal peptidase I
VKRIRLRSAILTGTLAVLTVAAWICFAPTGIGGSTSYVSTSGISMQPRFHSGDLALIRPVAQYRVGEIVAYHSTVLHVVVLHRIIAVHNGRYLFKGDNNNFVDPPVLRAQLIGSLWFRVGQGGRVLAWLHSPMVAAILAGLVALTLMLGADTGRRRRNRRRERASGPGRRRAQPGGTQGRAAPHPVNSRELLAASGAAVVLFLILELVAFSNPRSRASVRHVAYTQQVSFGYRARAPAGPVYPTGAVTTGDPIFLQLVHRVPVQIRYHLTAGAPAVISGTEHVLVRLTGPTGWTRRIAIGSSRSFTGARFTDGTTLDLPSLQTLLLRVERLTGIPAATGYSIAVAADVHIRGTVAGEPVSADFAPTLSFGLAPLQLQPGGGSATAGAPPGGFTPSQKARVAVSSAVPNRIGVATFTLPDALVRWIAMVGLLLAGVATALVVVLVQRGQAFGESARIQAHHGHLMVTITTGADLGWPPVDVTSMKALVHLAHHGGQMILHYAGEDADSYLVNDAGTVYRYQAQVPKVIWGEWSKPPADEVAA